MSATNVSPPSRRQARRIAAALLVGLALLVVVGMALAAIGNWLAPGLARTGVDADVTSYLTERRRPWLTELALIASWLADLPVVLVIVAVLGVASGLRLGRWRLLWLPFLAGAGALLISVVVKAVTARPRPSVTPRIVDALGAAFPSGHSIRAISVYGTLAWLLAATARARVVKVIVWSTAGVLIAAVGVSRIYLGVHWLTDVLAGYALGGAWLALLLVATRVPSQRDGSGTGEPGYGDNVEQIPE